MKFGKPNIFGVWFTDQSSKQTAIKEKRDITLVEISNTCIRLSIFLARNIGKNVGKFKMCKYSGKCNQNPSWSCKTICYRYT